MNHYGPRKSGAPNVGGLTGVNTYKFAEWVFDHDDLPTPASTNNMQLIIPAGALIVRAHWSNITAGTGGSAAYSGGLQQADGTEIDNDGLFTVSNVDNTLRQKSATTAGSAVAGTGALIGTVIANDAKLVVAGGASSTAGRFKILLEYLPNPADGVGSK